MHTTSTENVSTEMRKLLLEVPTMEDFTWDGNLCWPSNKEKKVDTILICPDALMIQVLLVGWTSIIPEINYISGPMLLLKTTTNGMLAHLLFTMNPVPISLIGSIQRWLLRDTESGSTVVILTLLCLLTIPWLGWESLLMSWICKSLSLTHNGLFLESILKLVDTHLCIRVFLLLELRVLVIWFLNGKELEQTRWSIISWLEKYWYEKLYKHTI